MTHYFNDDNIKQPHFYMKIKPPVDARMPGFSFPRVKAKELFNGLKILIIEKRELPKIYLRIGFPMGNKHDPGDKQGLAQLMRATIKKGTKNRNYDTIVEAIETAGGELGTQVNEDFFFIFGEFLSDYLETGLELMEDIALHPEFPADELEKERLKLIANLENEKSSPEFLARRRTTKTLYGAHPYSQYKTADSLKAITREDLVQYHRRHFIPNEAVMIIAGDVSESGAEETAEKYFSPWPGQPASEQSFPLPVEQQSRVIQLVDRPGSEQSNIVLGNLLFPRNNPQFERMLVMNKIVGGGGSGRLFLYLREEKGYTYGAYSSIQAYRDAGAWMASAEVRTEVTADAIHAFFDQFRKIKSQPVPDNELQNAKRYLMGVFPLQNETPASIAALALRQHLYRLPPKYWDNYLNTIQAVGKADVQQMAREYIKDNQMVIVIVGDAKKLQDRLQPFGDIQIFDQDDNRLK